MNEVKKDLAQAEPKKKEKRMKKFLVLDNKGKIMLKPKSSNKYKKYNHYHEIDDEHTIVDFGNGKFVANNEAIPLLKALNNIGLRTRTHHIGKEEWAFISILLDKDVSLEIKHIFEGYADRTKYNGKKELLISWKKQEKTNTE